MADMADLIARAFTTAAGRMADPDRSFSVEEVTRRLATDLRPHFTAPTLDHDISHPMPPISPVDTPAQHVAWAAGILDEMPHDRLSSGQSQSIAAALSHVLRAAELIERDADYLRADLPPAVRIDMTGPTTRRIPPKSCPTCGRDTSRSEEWSTGKCDDCHVLVDALGGTENLDPDPVRVAALALLRRLDNLTTVDFSRGREKAERDQLAIALGIEP